MDLKLPFTNNTTVKDKLSRPKLKGQVHFDLNLKNGAFLGTQWRGFN